MTIFYPIHTHAQTIRIETDDLLVRSGPGTQYEPIGHVNTGDTFQIEKSDSPWVQISYNDSTGWVHEDYITQVDSNIVATEEDENVFDTNKDVIKDSMTDITQRFPEQRRTSLDSIHLRESASISSDIVAHLKKNTLITVLNEEGDWYAVETADTSGYIKKNILDLVLTTPIGQSVLLDKTIVIDPGHGGIDVGAISINNDYESHLTMQTGRVLERILSRHGAHVVFTRDDDYYYSLSSRTTLSNYVKADMFLSLHYNSEPSYPTANGINTYYREPGFKVLAETVHQAILDESGANDRGIESGNYSVLRNNRRPGLLLELGFLSNPTEEQKLRNVGYHEQLAKGITNGIYHYFENRSY